jgi:hypothetical protein
MTIAVLLDCLQGRRWPGGPGIRTASLDQEDPRDTCKSDDFGWGLGLKGGRGKKEKCWTPSPENLAPPLIVSVADTRQ